MLYKKIIDFYKIWSIDEAPLDKASNMGMPQDFISDISSASEKA